MPKEHTIRDGDSVIQLSEVHGFFAATIWNAPENAALREQREDMNVLKAGDVVVIPDKQPKELPAETGREHVFQRQGIPAVFRLQVFEDETPRANQEYRLKVGDRIYRGQTDQDGKLEAFVSALATEGTLVVGPDEFTLDVRFGHLDPINEISGVQKRLINLGFDCGKVDGQLGPRTEAMLMMFQERFGLEQTGQPDQATIDQLESLHDEVSQYPADPDQGAA